MIAEARKELEDWAPSARHQVDAIKSMGFDPLAVGGKEIGGHVFKPDAEAAEDGARCARCGTADGVAWIAGAGENLCHRHQDDY